MIFMVEVVEYTGMSIECPYGDAVIECKSPKHCKMLLGIHLETVHGVTGAELRRILEGI